MQSCQNSKLRARIPKNSCLSYISPDESVLVVSQKPSKLALYKKSEFNEDPFNLGSGGDPSKESSSPSDYQLMKETDLNIGTLILLQWVDFDTEPVFVTVSNDKALVVLDAELQEIFRNEELLGTTDLCFFTCASLRRNKSGHIQGKYTCIESN